jgi:iron complex transport system permease protein
VSFLVRGRRPRLTPARFVATVGTCAAVAAVVFVVCPMISIVSGPGGRTLELVDTGSTIYLDIRLPRACAAMLIGGALAAAGTTFQALLRNPLAEPFTLGVSAGSSLAAVLAIRFGADATAGSFGVSAAALGGAVIVIYLVWQLGRVGSNLPPATLLLAGITLTMFCSAASMMVQYTADFVEIGHMLRWMMGGLTDIHGYDEVIRAALWIGAGLVVLLAMARTLDALAAGFEAAASVGVSTGVVQTVLFGVASLLVGGAIALAGPIGFVGLMVPHALRSIIGPDHRVLLPATILIGGAFLVLCDTIARVMLPSQQVPVGIVTALIGGPFFIGLLLAEKRRATMWSAR